MQGDGIRTAFEAPNLKDSVISRSLSETHLPDAAFVKALAMPGVQREIARRFGLLRLFSHSDLESLEAEIDSGEADVRKTAGGHRQAALVWSFEPGDKKDHFALGKNEIAALEKIVGSLRSGQWPLLNWSAAHTMGASFLASCLPGYIQSEEICGPLYLIKPSDPHRPFDVELKTIARWLGVKPSNQLAPEIIGALQKRNALLALCNTEALSSEEKFYSTDITHKLIEHAVRQAGKWKGPARLLTIGRSDYLAADFENGNFDISQEVEKALAVDVESRFEFFHSQWLRFCGLRGVNAAGEIGSRLKRAQWYYDGIMNRAVWPINMRLRAYFASNFENYAYFDSTEGFEKLAGNLENPRDIQFFFDDINAMLDRIPDKKRGTEVKLLRLMSTAKYWLTDSALEVLRRPNENPKVAALGRSAVAPAVAKLAPLIDCIEVADAEGATSKRYAMSIGVKSILQDNWRKEDPSTRSVAHWRVARRLYDQQNNKLLLNREFPYEPHWGRSRIHFLSECLRHLVRACESVPKDACSNIVQLPTGSFPSEPDQRLGGCNPYEVMNFCYETLYQAELNGNDARRRNARSLTKRHGAYTLAMEMLQLLSVPTEFGEPHWAIHPNHRRAFMLDVGFAALNVGDLKQAVLSFSALVEIDAHTGIKRDIIESLLNLSLAKAIQGAIARSRELWARAAGILKGLSHESDASVADILTRRLRGRNAYLLYLEGKFEEALREFSKLRRPEEPLRDGPRAQTRGVRDRDGITDPDLLHCYIATLENVREQGQETAEDAVGVCVKAMFRASSEGLQHEALGYKIAFAHLLRKRDQLAAAEAILDTVHSDILNHGCSERTYLAFLLEAGRLLISQRRHVRAYSCYLRPCLLRAAARGFDRVAWTARKYCVMAIESAREQAAFDAEWRRYISSLIVEERNYRAKFDPREFGLEGRDPLYGYGIDNAEATIDRFRTIADIAKIIGWLDKHVAFEK